MICGHAQGNQGILTLSQAFLGLQLASGPLFLRKTPEVFSSRSLRSRSFSPRSLSPCCFFSSRALSRAFSFRRVSFSFLKRSLRCLIFSSSSAKLAALRAGDVV